METNENRLEISVNGVKIAEAESLTVTHALDVPRYLYHCTTDDAAAKIKNEGLKPSPWDNAIYMAELPGDAASFGYVHKGSKPKNYMDKMPNPHLPLEEAIEELRLKQDIPDEWHEKLVVFRIDTHNLPKSRFDYGIDHAPGFWQLQGEVFTYSRRIPPSMIAVEYEIPLDKGTVVK